MTTNTNTESFAIKIEDTPMDLFSIVTVSKNKKTGPMPVSMSSCSTCPPSCAMREVCYAACGNLGTTWRKLSLGRIKTAMDWDAFCDKVRALRRHTSIWRHNQTGDLPGQDDRLDREKCLQLADANCADDRNRGGFTYSHYPVLDSDTTPEIAAHNREVIQEMNARGFVVSLSANSPAHADKLMALGVAPVTTVITSDSNQKRYTTPEGHSIHVCPASYDKDEDCAHCKLCSKNQQKFIIGFPAHGVKKRKADVIVKGIK